MATVIFSHAKITCEDVMVSGESSSGPSCSKGDSAIHWINFYPVDSVIGFPNTNPLGRNLSDGQRYPAFEQLGLGLSFVVMNQKKLLAKVATSDLKTPISSKSALQEAHLTKKKRKEKLWEKVSTFPHRGWVDGELIRNATYRSYETKNILKRAVRLIGLLERLVASQKTRPLAQFFVLEHTVRHFSGQLISYYILIWPLSLHQ